MKNQKKRQVPLLYKWNLIRRGEGSKYPIASISFFTKLQYHENVKNEQDWVLIIRHKSYIFEFLISKNDETQVRVWTGSTWITGSTGKWLNFCQQRQLLLGILMPIASKVLILWQSELHLPKEYGGNYPRFLWGTSKQTPLHLVMLLITWGLQYKRTRGAHQKFWKQTLER